MTAEPRGADRDQELDTELADPATWFSWADERRLDDPLTAFLLAEVGKQVEDEQEKNPAPTPGQEEGW
jgi:hypothetical protein